MKTLAVILLTFTGCYAQQVKPDTFKPNQVKPNVFMVDTLREPCEFLIRGQQKYVRGKAVILHSKAVTTGSTPTPDKYQILWYIHPQGNIVQRDQVVSIVK